MITADTLVLFAIVLDGVLISAGIIGESCSWPRRDVGTKIDSPISGLFQDRIGDRLFTHLGPMPIAGGAGELPSVAELWRLSRAVARS